MVSINLPYATALSASSQNIDADDACTALSRSFGATVIGELRSQPTWSNNIAGVNPDIRCAIGYAIFILSISGIFSSSSSSNIVFIITVSDVANVSNPTTCLSAASVLCFVLHSVLPRATDTSLRSLFV